MGFEHRMWRRRHGNGHRSPQAERGYRRGISGAGIFVSKPYQLRIPQLGATSPAGTDPSSPTPDTPYSLGWDEAPQKYVRTRSMTTGVSCLLYTSPSPRD